MLSILSDAYAKWVYHGSDYSKYSDREIKVLTDFGFLPSLIDINLIIEPLDDRFRMPVYSDPEDAGLDVYACLFDGIPEEGGKPVDSVLISAQETKLVCVGFKAGLPRGYFLDVRPRSGISLNTPLRIANAPGTIDTNFKNAVHVLISNTSLYDTYLPPWTCGEKGNRQGSYIIRTGDKIGQLVPHKRIAASISIGNVLDVGSDRGGGFGHTGV